MSERQSHQLIIIAGPNGAGKTTFALEFLPNEASCPVFVNADLIAAGLSPFSPEAAALRAGRLMLAEIERYVSQEANFAFETTLAGKRYAQRIPQWRAAGYEVHMLFLRLHDPELAIARVAERVAHGGHGVSEDVIRRRFSQGWANFENLYRTLVDSWRLYDNSGEHPILLDQGKKR